MCTQWLFEWEGLVRRTASQGAELERVGVTVCSLIRLCKSVEKPKPEIFSGGTRQDKIGNTKFEIRKSEMQARMTKKNDPPFA
jgi:hypothetical protein